MTNFWKKQKVKHPLYKIVGLWKIDPGIMKECPRSEYSACNWRVFDYGHDCVVCRIIHHSLYDRYYYQTRKNKPGAFELNTYNINGDFLDRRMCKSVDVATENFLKKHKPDKFKYKELL